MDLIFLDERMEKEFEKVIENNFTRFGNHIFFLARKKAYNPKGRSH